MKAPLAILLAACLSLDGVFSLVCWSCNDVDSNWGCWRLQFCSSEDNYCATTYTGAGIGLVNKKRSKTAQRHIREETMPANKKPNETETAQSEPAGIAVMCEEPTNLAVLMAWIIGGYSTQSISKGCVPVCPQGGINIGIAAVSVKCCSSSFCNISGSSSIKTNPVVLVAAVLASLLYLFAPRL